MRLGCLNHIVPVFIVGAGRSGTTLLRLSLNAHPQLSVFGETFSFFLYRKYGQLSHPTHLRRFLRDWRFMLSSSPHHTLADDPGVQQSLKETSDYAQAIDCMMGSFALREGKVRWGDKTPAHIFRLKEILTSFPEARIVHIVRDPRSTVSSAIRSFRHSRFTDWSVYAGTRYWLRCIAVHKRCLARPDCRYLAIRYEDLVNDSEKTLRQICAFIGLPYAAEMLDFYRDASKYAPKGSGGEVVPHQVLTQTPMSRDRVDAWRDQLSKRHLAIVEHLAKDDMIKLGYNPQGSAASCPVKSTLVRLGLQWRASELKRVLARRLRLSFWMLRTWAVGEFG